MNKLLKSPRQEAQENPERAKLLALKRWEKWARLIEAVHDRAELRCDYCFLQMDENGEIYCDECPLYKRPVCGYLLENGKRLSGNMHGDFMYNIHSALKYAKEIASAIKEDIKAKGDK